LLHQARNPSRMIEMGVRQDDGVNRIRRYRQVLPVALPPFFLSLEETAVHQCLQRWRAIVVDMDQMLRAGNHSGRAEKLDVAQEVLISYELREHSCRGDATQNDNSVGEKAVHHTSASLREGFDTENTERKHEDLIRAHP